MGDGKVRNLQGILVASILALTFSTSGVNAQTAEANVQTCLHTHSRDPDRMESVIAACTALIDSGQGDTQTRSDYYGHRGLAHDLRKESANAIDDYRKSLQLNPDNPLIRILLDCVTGADPDQC